MTKGIIYLPLEIVTREYAGKLLVALELAAKGYHAVIGHKGPVNKAALNARPPGIYYYKSAGLGIKTRPEFLSWITKNKFITVVQDEEAGIAHENFSDFFKIRRGLEHFKNRNAFFCWGIDEYKFLAERYPENQRKLYLSGSPRTFLWTPEAKQYHNEEMKIIRKQYGEYYLFVSNFTYGNNILPEKDHIKRLLNKFGDSQDSLALIRQRVEQDKRLLKQFASAAIMVRLAFGKPVIIRPHPKEDKSTWKGILNNNPGIHVQTQLDLNAWIRGARAVIQNGCTTAIEARCGRSVPVFAYAEDPMDITNRPNGFPNLIARQAVGMKELRNLLENMDNIWPAFLQKSPDSVLDQKVVRPPEGSPRVIADIISSLAEKAGGLYSGNLPMRPGGVYSSLNRARKSLKKMIFKMDTPSRISNNKRRPITLQQVALDIGRASEVLNFDGDVFFVREIYDNCYLIGLR